MNADWEVEVGGGTPDHAAPIIDALWPGFLDLHQHPERIGEITEAAGFLPLADLLLRLNAPDSPIWTAKCDLWQPDAIDSALACYIDILPRQGQVFAEWQQAVDYCRAWIAQLEPIALPECRAELIVRQAIAGKAEGFGITAYLSAEGPDQSAVSISLAHALTAFADAIPPATPPATADSRLQ